MRKTTLLLLLAAACANNSSQRGSPGPGNGGDDRACLRIEEGAGPDGSVPLQVEVMASGLEVPWGIAFLPDGDLLVTERPGRIRLVRDGALVETPVATVDVAAQGEGGLLGIALDPDFEENRAFYVYFTTDEDNRVQRWTLAEDGASAQPGEVIVEGIPTAGVHVGGRLRIGPDDRLWIATGDAQEMEASRDWSTTAGKLLRVATDGSVPDDNPRAGNPAVIAGLRNTQGFDWREDGSLVIADHGPSGEMGLQGNDEVDVARVGDDLGWPEQIGCERVEGAVTPVISWREALPPGGVAIVRGDALPDFEGDVVVTALGARQLQRLVLSADGQVERNEVYLRNEWGRLREAVLGPDGAVWITTSNCDGRGDCPEEGDRILRVTQGG